MQVATGTAAVVRRGAVRFALAALLAAGAAIVPSAAAVAKPTSTPEERAAAIVRPAVVYIEVQWEGWVRDKITGKLWDPDSVAFTTRCSGFAVSNDGFIVAAGHCVDPGVEGVGLSFFEEIAARYLKAGVIGRSQLQTVIDDMVANAEVEGKSAGEAAVRKVFVQRGVAKSGRTSGEAIQARVVSFHPVSDGDLTLLKVEKSNQPVVVLADSAEIQIGTDVLAIGYPASADNISDATLEPSTKDGKISNKRTEGGVPFYETSVATTAGMSGGPVANLNGEVIGLISHGPAADKRAVNFLAPSSVIAGELSKNGVKNQLGKIDKDYRDGLTDYYDGKYTAAIERFDQVLAAVPSHTQAQEYRAQAVSRRSTEGDGAGGRLALLVVVGLACLFLVIVVVVTILLLVRSKKRGRPAPAGVPPVRHPPISGPPSLRYCTNCGSGAPPGTKLCDTCGLQFS
jgi:serine protease Do